jgi:hypothetical protein
MDSQLFLHPHQHGNCIQPLLVNLPSGNPFAETLQLLNRQPALKPFLNDSFIIPLRIEQGLA